MLNEILSSHSVHGPTGPQGVCKSRGKLLQHLRSCDLHLLRFSCNKHTQNPDVFNFDGMLQLKRLWLVHSTYWRDKDRKSLRREMRGRSGLGEQKRTATIRWDRMWRGRRGWGEVIRNWTSDSQSSHEFDNFLTAQPSWDRSLGIIGSSCANLLLQAAKHQTWHEGHEEGVTKNWYWSFLRHRHHMSNWTTSPPPPTHPHTHH